MPVARQVPRPYQIRTQSNPKANHSGYLALKLIREYQRVSGNVFLDAISGDSGRQALNVRSLCLTCDVHGVLQANKQVLVKRRKDSHYDEGAKEAYGELGGVDAVNQHFRTMITIYLKQRPISVRLEDILDNKVDVGGINLASFRKECPELVDFYHEYQKFISMWEEVTKMKRVERKSTVDLLKSKFKSTSSVSVRPSTTPGVIEKGSFQQISQQSSLKRPQTAPDSQLKAMYSSIVQTFIMEGCEKNIKLDNKDEVLSDEITPLTLMPAYRHVMQTMRHQILPDYLKKSYQAICYDLVSVPMEQPQVERTNQL